MTTTEFLQKACEIHGQYEYPDLSFTKMSEIITIHCKIHGEFKQRVSVHINDKCGCPQCGALKRDQKRLASPDKFIAKSKTIHGEDHYDYSEIEYTGSHNKVTLICKIHNNRFQIAPYAHIANKNPQGCKLCGYEKRVIPHQKSNDTFIAQCKEKWEYDYSITQYISKTQKIKFVCKEHGVQEQLPANHLRNGCAMCNLGGRPHKYTPKNFVSKCQEKHPNCNYTNTEYIGSHDPIKIKCAIHGVEFERLAYIHFNSLHGCPFCAAEASSSQGEKELRDFVRSFYKGKILSNDRDVLGGKELDIYCPDVNIALEYHGCFFHSELFAKPYKHRHKADLCVRNNIKLIQVFDYEWETKREIVQSRIKSIFGKNDRVIPGRKVQVRYLTLAEKNNFLAKNHLQGADHSSVYIGLVFGDEIVGCMTFGCARFDKTFDGLELIRYCLSLNTTVIGGAEKLLKFFSKNHKDKVVSYADRRWSIGGIYERLGFTLIPGRKIVPNYFYYHLGTKEILSRQKCVKKNLLKENPDKKDMSEHDIMRELGYVRVFDAGNLKYILE